MGKVIANATMSLDGYIATPDDGIGHLFDWYDAGDIEVANAGHPGYLPPFHLTPESAAYWRQWVDQIGALIVGRTLFDVTDGWQGKHPLGVPVVVMTHQPPTDWSYPGSEDFHFVTTGIQDAVAQAQRTAGDRTVAVAAGTVAEQALRAGLLDEIAIDLAPVFLGTGKRFLAGLDVETVLGEPITVLAASKVIHLRYPVAAGTE
ncbi:MAG: dihydrofolate reductase [Schumannella sp.]|nr:dihydrofolate reductase [Schumannella sp.]